MKKYVAAAVLVFPLIFSIPVVANAPIEGVMQAYVVERGSDNKESLIAVSDVQPDQVVEYVLTYTNKSNSAINGLTVVGPVPAGTSYVNDTARSQVEANFLVSIDGGKTFEAEPVKRTRKKSSGELVEVIIPAEKYTHVQWQAKTAIDGAGGSQLYRYRVRVR